jgi:hypothetical protein
MTQAGSASGGVDDDGGGEVGGDELDEGEPSWAGEAGGDEAGDREGDRAGSGEHARDRSRSGAGEGPPEVGPAPGAALEARTGVADTSDASTCGVGPGTPAEACRGGGT